MAAEAVQSFQHEAEFEFNKLSDHIRNLLRKGSEVTADQLEQARFACENP